MRDEPCAYCGRALDDSIDGLGGMNAPVQVLEGMNAPVQVLGGMNAPVQVRATMEGGYTAVACWNAQIVLHAGAQIRGLASRANRNGRWDDDLPTLWDWAMAANEDEADGRWLRTFEALRFSTIVGQNPRSWTRPSTKAPVYTTHSRTCCEPRGTA